MYDYIKCDDELITKSSAKAEIEAYFAHISKIDKQRKTKIEAMRIDLLSCIGGIAPVVDVREIVRGEWIERKDIYPHKPDGEITSWSYKCSHCNQLSQLKYNFCFNCGADMRGEKDV